MLTYSLATKYSQPLSDKNIGKAWLQFVYRPKQVAYTTGYVAVKPWFNTFRSNVKHPGNYDHKGLNTFLLQDSEHRNRFNWDVNQTETGETPDVFPPLPSLNGKVGRARQQSGQHAVLSPLATVNVHLHLSKHPKAPFLQDSLDVWPPAGPPSFSIDCCDRNLLYPPPRCDIFPPPNRPYFIVVLREAMVRDNIKSPHGSAIAGLYCWWQGSLDCWCEGASAAMTDWPVPHDLFDALAVPLPFGVGPPQYKGKPEARLRGYREHN